MTLCGMIKCSLVTKDPGDLGAAYSACALEHFAAVLHCLFMRVLHGTDLTTLDTIALTGAELAGLLTAHEDHLWCTTSEDDGRSTLA